MPWFLELLVEMNTQIRSKEKGYSHSRKWHPSTDGAVEARDPRWPLRHCPAGSCLFSLRIWSGLGPSLCPLGTFNHTVSKYLVPFRMPLDSESYSTQNDSILALKGYLLNTTAWIRFLIKVQGEAEKGENKESSTYQVSLLHNKSI